MKNVLISFVGVNDSNKENDGAILTVFKDKEQKYDEVYLLWNPSGFVNFYEIAQYIKSEIIKRKLCKEVKLFSFECEDVTDHNEIYPNLLTFCKSIFTKNKNFTAAIASGTPSMQACWILMAESGDFPLRIIRSNDPKYGKPFVSQVKLGTSLPKILRLEKENNQLKKNLLNDVTVNIKKAELKIGKKSINLSPVEFSYYRYFLERANDESEYLRIDVDIVPPELYNSIIKFHRESYPQADSNRLLSEKNKTIKSSTFRSNVTKLNSKIKSLLESNASVNFYLVESEGERFRKSYGINLPKEKIKIVK